MAAQTHSRWSAAAAGFRSLHLTELAIRLAFFCDPEGQFGGKSALNASRGRGTWCLAPVSSGSIVCSDRWTRRL